MSASRKSAARSRGKSVKPKIRGGANGTASSKASSSQLRAYIQLMRFDRPIGTLLLLWPTLWSLWLAANGLPRWDVLVIFILGTILMRAAGCVINDYADRELDGHVERTRNRPLARGVIAPKHALILCAVLCLLAFGLVLLTNALTIKLAFVGLGLALCYPFMKRYTHLPQIVLGAAFSWSIPMAFAAQTGALPPEIWLVYIANLLWTVVYDTFYAMVDRPDDLKVGIKSTAILFGENDRVITGALQAMTLLALVMVGTRFELRWFYYMGVTVAGALFVYQQWLIRARHRPACFKAFLNNNWVGMAVFVGLVLHFSLS